MKSVGGVTLFATVNSDPRRESDVSAATLSGESVFAWIVLIAKAVTAELMTATPQAKRVILP